MTRLIALNLHGCLEDVQQPDCRPTRDLKHREGSSQPANGEDARVQSLPDLVKMIEKLEAQ